MAEKACVYFVILFAIGVIFAVASLLAAGFQDPGVLPRSRGGKDYGHGEIPPPPQYAPIILAGKEASVKYCYTCGIWRPPRATHCSDCNHCVGK